MKKNLFFAAILCIGLLAIINSCVKDTFTEQDAYDQQRKSALQQDSIAKSNMELEAQLAQEQALLLDSLKKVGGVINYSVGVIVASESSWWSDYFILYDKGEKSNMGLDGAVVTIAQHGRVFTFTTGADGIASFKDLRVGTANVNITKTGYTEVDFVVELPPLTEGTHTEGNNYDDGSWTSDSTTNNIVDIVRHVATLVPVFSLTDNLSTISGKATVETDLTNDAPEVAANVKIKGIIDVEEYDFWTKYIYEPNLIDYWDYGIKPNEGFNTFYGKIKQIAFHSTISSATTDANGLFTMQVPSTPQGLPIDFEVDQFAADQKILLPALFGVPVWGVQTVRTLYGTGVGSYTPIPNLGLSQMNVQSAYVTFSAPTGTPAAQPTTTATATAVLTSSGIVSINITNPGEGYTQSPLVRITKGSVINSVQAEGTAVLTGGKVTSVTIDSPGSGYKPGDSPTVTFVENIQQTATATPKMGYSIATIALGAAGSGYTAAPTVTINSNTGTGATAIANMTGYVSAINVTNAGTGYTATPTVVIAPSSGTQATAGVVTMTANNPVHSVTVPGTYVQWTRRKLGTRITGDGSGAITDSTTLGTAGRLEVINIVNGGAGYLTAPTVTITGGGGTGAVATATILGGAVNSITINNPGQNYTTAPTVTLTAAPVGGTNATANCTIEFRVTGVNVTANGNGYTTASVQFENAPQSGVFIAPPGAGGPLVVNFSKGIASIAVATPGTEYTAAPAVTITPSNGVVGTAATATTTIAYSVKNYVVTNQGSGYEFGDATVTVGAPAAGGVQAVPGAIGRTNGVLKRIIMGAPGVGYTAAPNVILTLGGGTVPVKQAEMTATVSGGQITGITITDPGQGYDYGTDASYGISITTYNSSAAATAKPNPESGKISFIQVNNTGSGYAVVPEVEIFNDSQGDANGFGTGATATAVVTDGRVSAVNVTNAGSGYYVAPNVRIVVVSSVKTAMGRADVSGDGRIIGVDFSNPGGGWPGYQFTQGYGYETPPTVTFTPSVPGKGADAVGIAQINNGQVTGVIMTNQGSGYTGRNKPLLMSYTITTNGIYATASKSYIIDIYFGTGRKTVTEQGIF
jgi:hypothetical protein